MKVGIDVSQMNLLNKTRGVGFYTKYLLESLQKYTDLDVTLIESLTSEKFDLIHYPFFDLFYPTLPFKKTAPTIVTIHDVIPLIFPKHFPKGLKGAVNLERQKWALKNVETVITDSETSKKDITRYLKVDEKKIYPIYLAPAAHFQQIKDQKKLAGTREKFNLPEKFALFVGNVNWNKNILGIAEACVRANIDLFLVGSSFGKKENLKHPEMASFTEFLKTYSSHPKIHIIGYVEDEEVVNLLNLATVFLFPSFYEGFGLPILEAQACNLPVITSNRSSTKEVAGESALLVDPENVKEIEEAIKIVFNDENLRKKLVRAGQENVKLFSWEKTAKETEQVYQKVYDSSN